MTKLRVKPRYFDKTGETLYTSKEIGIEGKINNKPIITPITVFDTKEIRLTDKIAGATLGLNEIFRSPSLNQDKTSLGNLVYDAKKQHQFNTSIKNQLGKLDGSVIFFFEFKGRKYPQEIERDFILDTEYSYSDIPCLPITPFLIKNIKDETSFQKYLTFIKGCIEYLKSFNEKPIMGIIPDLGYGYLVELIKLYVEKDVNAYCIDLDCHTPISHKPAILKCIRILRDHEMFEESFFYGLNVNSGRFVKNKHVVPAKDVLSFGFGLDAIGRKHRVKFPSRETIEKLGSRWKPLDRKTNRFRLFNKDEYGYYRAEHVKEMENYPGDSSIPLETFTKNFSVNDIAIRHQERIFNMEQLGLEAFRLQNVIKYDAPIKYLEPKKQMNRKAIKQIIRFKENVFKSDTSQEL